MTQKDQAYSIVNEIQQHEVTLQLSVKDEYHYIDVKSAKRIALIMVQKLQDTEAKPPMGYTSSYDYWEGIKNEIKAI